MNRYINSQKFRVNKEIKSPQVRLISEDGAQLGIFSIKEALAIAEKENTDLVELNASSIPSVCRLLDFGKFKYKQTKKEKEARKRQHVIKVKEVKLRPSIDPHDYSIKLDNAKKFLEKGNKVKVTLVFRGREMAHKEIGEEVLKNFCIDLVATKLGAMETDAKRLGKTMMTVIAPVKTH